MMDAWNHWLQRLFSGSDSPGDGDLPASKKRAQQVMLIAGLGLLLLILSRFDTPQSRDREPVQNAGVQLPLVSRPETTYEGELERRLEQWLSAMAGVGKVQVLVTLERTERYEYVVERTEERTVSEEPADSGGIRVNRDDRVTERPVLRRDDQGRNEAPILVTTYSPQVRGVVVLAEGAYDPRIRLQIIKAVQTVLGLPAHRVEVLTKKE